MGLGFGAMGFLLVVAVRGGSDDAVPEGPPIVTDLDASAPAGDAGQLVPVPPSGDAAHPPDAAPDAPPPPPEPPPPPPPPPIFRVAQLAGDPSILLTDGTIGKRAVLTALAAAGLGRAESYRLTHALGKVHNLNHTSPSDTFHLAKQKGSGHVVAFEYVTSPVDVFQARDEGGTLTATKLDLHVQTKRLALPVILASSDVKGALVKAGFEEDIVQRLDDALDGHAELSDIHAGSRFRVLATEQRLEGVFLRYASIDALEYTPGERGAVALRVYRFPPVDPDKVAVGTTHPASFYDGRGQQPYHGGWRIPVPSARIASRFNPHRMHPTLHVVMPHNGVDFAAPTGTPIYAAASGTVKTAGDSGPCGNMVQIEHNAGLISSYCHMSKFAAGLHVGQHVDTRQLLGYVGQTGRATGPHLHFAIKRNGIFIDPLAMKLDGVRVVPPSQRDEFEEVRGELDKALDAIVLTPSDAGALPSPSVATAPDAGVSDAAPDGPVDDLIFDETTQ